MHATLDLLLTTRRKAVCVLAGLTLVACGGGDSGSGGGSTAPSVWTTSKLMGTSGTTEGNAVATDASGNVYVVGTTDVSLDGNPLMGTTDFFLTKYNSVGEKIFTKQMGVAGADTEGLALAVASNGNIFVAGRTSGNLDLQNKRGAKDYFVSSYTSSGVPRYTVLHGVTGAETEARSITVDPSGNNFFVAGTTKGNLNSNVNTNVFNAFVSKHSAADGLRTFSSQVGASTGNSATEGNGVALGQDGSIYLAGNTSDALNGSPATGTRDYFFAKFDASGTLTYVRQSGVSVGSIFTNGNSILVDSSNVYLTGYTTGALDGATPIATRGLFLTKYDIAGNLQRTVLLAASTDDTYARSIVKGIDGKLYAAGYTDGALDGNSKVGSSDLFLSRFASNLDKESTKQFGVAGGATRGKSVATDASGNIFIAGDTTGALDGIAFTGIQAAFVTKYNSAGVKQ
jgi:hypothetical protein